VFPTDWPDLLAEIAYSGKYVDLDLSDCTMTEGTSGEFDPNAAGTNGSGKNKIVSLILPNAATSIAGGNYFSSFQQYFTELKSVSGANIAASSNYALRGCNKLTTVDFPTATSIGESAFGECTALTEVSIPKAQTIGQGAFTACLNMAEASFPAAETIGGYAFQSCTGLTEVNLPAAKSIGDCAFGQTGTEKALAVTLGKTPPTLGDQMFYNVSSKTVAVKVPSDAEEYGDSPMDTTTENWGNAFRGKGWTGTNYGYDSVNSNINLTIESLEPEEQTE
jgi:hypothetical protein